MRSTTRCIDLLLAGGLLFGRRRRRWMLARAALNAALAVDYRQPAPGVPSDLRRRVSHALTALTIIDGAAALALR
jgi:hypothetical protein